MAQYQHSAWEIFLYVSCLFATLSNAIRESDVGKQDWYNQSVGDIFQAHYRNDYVYLASRQNLLASANPADIRDIKWRRMFDQTSRGQIQAVHFAEDLIWVVFANGRPQCLGIDYAHGNIKKEVDISNTTQIVDSLYLNDEIYVVTEDGEVMALDQSDVLWHKILGSEPHWLLADESGLFAVGASGRWTRLTFDGQIQSSEDLGIALVSCVAYSERQSLFCRHGSEIVRLDLSAGQLRSVDPGLTVENGGWLCQGRHCRLMDTDTGLDVVYGSRTWTIPYIEEKELIVEGPVRFAHSDGKNRALIVTDELEVYCYMNGRLTSRSDQGLAVTKDVLISPPVVVMTTETGVVVGLRICDGVQIWRIGNIESRPVLLDRCTGRDEMFSLWRNDVEAKVIMFDPVNGKVLSSKVFEDGDLHFSRDACSLWRKQDNRFSLTWKNSTEERDALIINQLAPNMLQCQLTNGKSLWSLQVGSNDAQIVRVAFKTDRIARTNWMILPDRSIIHKRLDADVFAALSYSEILKSLYVYVIKARTGQILYAKAHHKARGPFMITGAENSIVYSFQNPQSELDYSPRTQLMTVSLFREDKPVIDKIILPTPLQCIGVSVTQKGITSRSLLMGTASGHLYEVNWDFSSLQYKRYSEGNLIFQAPDQTIINYYNLMRNCRHVSSAPHPQSESRSYVVAYGLDLFSAVIQPSKSFDTLRDDVNKKFIVVLVCALLLGAFGSRYWARRCALENAWE